MPRSWQHGEGLSPIFHKHQKQGIWVMEIGGFGVLGQSGQKDAIGLDTYS